MEKSLTCCFIGHGRLPKEKIEHIIIRLDCEVEKLISQGVTTFISDGALGFNQVAASLIIAKKEMGRKIRLFFALPCRNRAKLWNAKQKNLYHSLLTEADGVIYASKKYYNGRIKKNNRYMIDHSDYCICALLYPFNRIGQTVGYAKQKGLKVINVAS